MCGRKHVQTRNIKEAHAPWKARSMLNQEIQGKRMPQGSQEACETKENEESACPVEGKEHAKPREMKKAHALWKPRSMRNQEI